MTTTRSLLLVATLTALGCADGAQLPTEAAPQFAKPGAPAGDPTATFILPESGYGLLGDGIAAYSDGNGGSHYAYGVCGVNAKIFATTEASNSGDAIMHTSNPKFSDRKCPHYPRRVAIDYGTGVQLETVFINLRGIHNTGYAIPVGETRAHELRINPDASAVCPGALIFNRVFQGNAVDGALVHVTRSAGDRWLVQSDDPGTPEVERGRAYCTSSGASHDVDVRLEVVASRPL